MRHKINWDNVQVALDVLDMSVAEGSALRVYVDTLRANICPKITKIKAGREKARESVYRSRAENGRVDGLTKDEREIRANAIKQAMVARMRRMVECSDNGNMMKGDK